MKIFEKDVKKAYALLNLKRRIVGVSLIKNKQEFDSYDVVNLINPLSYCVAVKSASLGHRIKFDIKTSDCGGSTRALGLEKPSDDFLDGSSPYKLGLFKDEEVAKRSALETSNVLSNTYGILVQPIEFFRNDDTPDVILVIGTPRELMRVIQGYTYNKGISKQFSMSGNQGVCVEATAYPLIHNTVNVSMFCSGTRFLAQWEEEEAVAGIPFSLFSEVVDGIYHTVNAVEMDERKSHISQEFISNGIECIKMEYGKTYYTEYEKEKREKRKDEKH